MAFKKNTRKKSANKNKKPKSEIIGDNNASASEDAQNCPETAKKTRGYGRKDANSLNDKQRKLCDEYLLCNNGKQAAIKAGYAVKGASAYASRLLKQPNVKRYLDSRREKIGILSEISPQYVLERLKDVVERCMSATPVTAPNGKPVLDENGNPTYRFDSSGANKALELIGKYLGLFNADQSGAAGASAKVVLEIQSIREALMQEQEASRRARRAAAATATEADAITAGDIVAGAVAAEEAEEDGLMEGSTYAEAVAAGSGKDLEAAAHKVGGSI